MIRRKWVDIGSDVNWIDHGGLWAMQIGARSYFVIEFNNLADCDLKGYNVCLSLVELDNPQLPRALECCDSSEDAPELELVSALRRYGAHAPLFDESGTSSKALLRLAKGEAFRLRQDPDALQAALGRPCNRIGSTAEEYARGDILSGVLRGVSEGNPEAEILLKMGVR